MKMLRFRWGVGVGWGGRLTFVTVIRRWWRYVDDVTMQMGWGGLGSVGVDSGGG